MRVLLHETECWRSKVLNQMLLSSLLVFQKQFWQQTVGLTSQNSAKMIDFNQSSCFNVSDTNPFTKKKINGFKLRFKPLLFDSPPNMSIFLSHNNFFTLSCQISCINRINDICIHQLQKTALIATKLQINAWYLYLLIRLTEDGFLLKSSVLTTYFIEFNVKISK